MKVVTAYQSEDGSLHLESVHAQAADRRHNIASRVDAFLAASPIGSYEHVEMKAWLRSERGQDALRALVGKDLYVAPAP